jgi:hypothetical protein
MITPFMDIWDYCHFTIATHSLVEEEECFDVIEYIIYNLLVDDLLDSGLMNHVNNC